MSEVKQIALLDDVSNRLKSRVLRNMLPTLAMPVASLRIHMKSRLLTIVVLVAGALAAGACSDPFSATASYANVVDTLKAYSLSGTSSILPAALNLSTAQVVRVDGDFAYDVVFDIDSADRAVVYPVRLIGGPYASSRTVGIQKFTGSFDAYTKAPTGGYAYDSTAVLGPGQGIVLQLANATICQYQFSSFMYAKLVIDSVVPAERAIYFRALVGNNCGFRTLTPGTPKN